MPKGKSMLNLSRDTIQKVRTEEINKNKSQEDKHKENKLKHQSINVNEIKKEIQQEKSSDDVWDKVKKFYVEHASKPTYLETARRFNLGDVDVAHVARDDKWFEQRIIYWSQVAADRQQQIYQVNNNLFQSLSTVAQLSMREHAKTMLDIDEKRKKNISAKKKEYDESYDIAKTMNMIKLLTTNMEVLQEQFGSESRLEDMEDKEIMELLSEDEVYELDHYYNIDDDEEEDDGLI